MSPQRTVRFQDEPELIPAISQEQRMPGLVSGNWWSRKEFQRFRIDHRMMAQCIRRRHKADASNPSSYTNVLCSTYQSCVDGFSPSEMNVMQLAGWMERGTSRLGLEKLSVKTLNKERQKVSQSAIQSVLEAQSGKTNFDGNDAKSIRRVYRKFAESARLFAIALADAAELAVKQEDEAALNYMPGSTVSPKISSAILRFKMQRRLLLEKSRRLPLADQLTLPSQRRCCTEAA